jgi:4-amino-4-deoxy-L-arabinose transferase-like glycosyltransferase
MSEKRSKQLTTFALIAILAIGAFLRLYELGAYSIGNTYYAATVKSMLTSWSNFFFGSFEPGGSVTVDKPPLGFWIQSISAAMLGVNGFSLALPNALAGIGSIALVYHLVKEQFNRGAGLVAALVLAVFPITIATERNNTIDGLLVFVLLLAVWAVWKAVQSGKFRYLLLGAFIIGLGFNIKMLQAYMIIPAIYALYFFGAKQGWWTRIWQLGVATTLLVAVSLSWAITVDLVPGEYRPFIGSSEDNTVLELIIGHNGLSRLGLNDNARGGGDGGNQPQQAPDGQQAGRTPVNAVPSNQQPPQQAVDACSGLTLGDACSVELPQRTIDGSCAEPPQFDTLVCSPNDRAPQNAQVSGNGQRPPNDGNPQGAPPQGGGRNASETGEAGIARLFSEPLVTEASWLLPLALFSILLTGTTLLMRRPDQSDNSLSNDEIPNDNQTPLNMVRRILTAKEFLALLLWSLWLLPVMAYFSFTTGLFHRYYLIMLGAPVAALTGMAFWSVTQLFKRNRCLGFGTLLFIVVLTLGFQALMLSNYTTTDWVLPTAIVLALVGLITLAFGGWSVVKDFARQLDRRSNLLNDETVTAQVHAPRRFMQNLGLTFVLLALLVAPATWATLAAVNPDPNVALPTATLNDTTQASFMTPNNTTMSENETAIMNYLLENTEPDSYLLATTNAKVASPYILATGRAVLTFGGFSGSDPIFEVSEIVEMVESGELRFILYNDTMNQAHRDIAAWVTEACVPVSVPGVSTRRAIPAQGQNQQNVGQRPPSENQVLYDCAQ